MSQHRVSFVVPNISSNILGAATALAREVQCDFDVDIVGPDFGEGINPMYADAFSYTAIPAQRMYRIPDYWRVMRTLSASVTGDIVVAVKAFMNTVPVALEKKRQGKCAVTYLDEWDGATFAQLPVHEKIKGWLKHWHHPLEEPYFSRVERMIGRCDAVVSTTSFLAQRFGGEVIHLGADCDTFQPGTEEARAQLRAELGLGQVELVVFGGVVRPHKGVERLLDALAMVQRDLKLLVVGPRTEHLRAIQEHPTWSSIIHCIGAQPKAAMPKYVDLADVIVLPQEDNALAHSQMPCKVFEAMAMAKPIIATGVSDMADVLQGCGIIVPPSDAKTLAVRIEDVLSDKEEAARLGREARKKCLAQYSRDSTGRQFTELLHRTLRDAS